MFNGLYRRPFPYVTREFPFFERARVELCSPAHVGCEKHAIDFLVPEGSLVCAPRAGVVIAVKDDSDRGGPDKLFKHDANFIVIDHMSPTAKLLGYTQLIPDEEELGGGFNPVRLALSEFERSIIVHLKKGSLRVEVGDRVCAGQVIAVQGSTGWTYEPHIHFAVYRNGTSVPIDFGYFY